MKEIPILFSTEMVQALLAGRKTMTRRIVKMYATSDAHPMRQNATWLQENKTCPYGEVGDVLWVREGFCPGYFDDGKHAYKADWNKVAEELVPKPKWKPSIHMPKSACRIYLKVKSVRIERLKDITEKDALNEGIKVIEKDEAYYDYMKGAGSYAGPIGSFYSLWRSINGEESFNANPWVWVIEFERVAKP
jgi:hypothetical protein